MSETLVGTVAQYDFEKGYGFLEAESGRRYFVHQTQILMNGFRALVEGEAVSFVAGKDSRGRVQAIEVQRF